MPTSTHSDAPRSHPNGNIKQPRPFEWRFPPSDERDPAKVEHALRERIKELEHQLTIERQALQETNIALRTVLSRIEDEKHEVRRDVEANVEKVLMPILNALALRVPKGQRGYVNLLRDNLTDMTSPFVNELSRAYSSLTPTEIRICKMIRDGMRTKEIAQIRGVSPATVNRHREHIRCKLGIANQAINLTTHLQATM